MYDKAKGPCLIINGERCEHTYRNDKDSSLTTDKSRKHSQCLQKMENIISISV